MYIAFLGYNSKQTKLISFLRNKNHVIKNFNNDLPDLSKFDLVISFGYKKKIDEKIIMSLKRPAINLHISYLPFNKGSHPNFWSFIENTPKGVTIHEIDKKIDNGDIIFQKKIKFNKKLNNFKSTYQFLLKEIEKIFIDNFQSIANYNYNKIKQSSKGTFHLISDLPKWDNIWKFDIADAITKYNEEKRIKILNYKVIIILSKELNYLGGLTKESKARAELASKIYGILNKKPLILVMGWNYRSGIKISLAEAFKKHLMNSCLVKNKKIYSDNRPRDTVGEALFSFIKLKELNRISNICVITHKSHRKRAEKIFDFVYNKNIQFKFECINDIETDKIKIKEKTSLLEFKKTFKGVEKGNIENIILKLKTSHPYYNGKKYKKIDL